MEQMWAAIIGAVALVGIPVGAWLSRRFTKEGRLLLRIERLGAVHQVVPDSPQRDALGRRVLLLVEELNEWIDVPKEHPLAGTALSGCGAYMRLASLSGQSIQETASS